MTARLFGLSEETATLIGNWLLVAVCIVALLLALHIYFTTFVTGRLSADRQLEARVLAVLDDLEAEHPALVAEARDLHGHLVTQAWVIRVSNLSTRTLLTGEQRTALNAALWPNRYTATPSSPKAQVST